jgi:hypothetical protein
MHPVKAAAGAGRVYRSQWWQRALAVLFPIMVPLWGAISGGWDTVTTAIVFIFCAYIPACAFMATVTLSDDAIELRTLFSRRRLRFDQIRGRREYVGYGRYGGTRRFKLEPNDRRLPTLKFDKDYTFDRVFYDWFNKLPDLDAMDTAKPRDAGLGWG